MKANLRTLGLTLLAALALGAIAVSGARAEQPARLAVEGGEAVTIDGSQPEKQVQVLTRLGKQIFCETASYHAEAEDEAEAVSLSPTYEGCTMLGVGPATVKANGCTWVLNLTQEGSSFAAITDLVCPEGKQLEVLAYVSEAKHTAGTTVCEYTFATQKGVEAVALTNKASSEATPKDWILADLEISGLSSKSLKNELICGAESNSTATLEGELELKGTDGEEGANGIGIIDLHQVHTEETEETEETAETEETEETAETEATENAQITTETTTETLDVSQGLEQLVYTRGARTYSCEVANFHGVGESGDSTIDLEPEYDECITNLGGPMTVTHTGCFYRLRLAADEEGAGHTWSARTSLHCAEGKHVVIHAYLNYEQYTTKPAEPSCQYTYTDWAEGKPTKTNQNLGTIELTNEPASEETTKDWLFAHVDIEGIHSKRTRGSALLCGPEVHTTGILQGAVQFKGTTLEGNPAGITISTS